MSDTIANRYDQEAAERAVNHVPPHSLQLERAVLGLMLLSTDATDEIIASDLRPGVFYSPTHQHLYDTIVSLNAKGSAVDVLTVAEALGVEFLEMVDSRRGLVELQGDAGYASSIATYADLLRKYRALRNLIGTGAELQQLGYDQVLADIGVTIDDAEKRLFEVTEEHRGSTGRGPKAPAELMGEYLDILEERAQSDELITGLPTGWIDYDTITMGYRPDSLNVVAARPGGGKSSFAVGAAAKVAVEHGRPVLFFSLEMTAHDLMQRVVSVLGGIDGTTLQRGDLTDTHWKTITHVAGEIASAPLFIDDTPVLTMMELRAKARRAKSTTAGDLGLIIVDYLQLMSPTQNGRRAENRQVEVAEMSRGLKLLARELETPVMALSQLNRGLELRQDKRPMLADLRESGSIENDADTVTFLYREEMYDDNPDAKGKAEAIVAKNRHGQTGKAHLQWDAPLTRFSDMAPSYVSVPPPEASQASFDH